MTQEISETMVERVARAIRRAQFLNPAQWQDNVEEARAAITAMREPTTRILDNVYDGEEHGSPKSATDIWQHMIDAALAEEPAREL